MQTYADRREAGRSLAAALACYREPSDVVVLALPRGGVPVAYEVAQALSAPLGVFVVRRLVAPGHPELALGALASGGSFVLNPKVIDQLHVTSAELSSAVAAATCELVRAEGAYQRGHAAPPVAGRTVLLVDDGLATGSTMRSAIEALRQRKPARIVAAVPVGSADKCAEVASIADQLVCLEQPEPFLAVSSWYADFSETTDEDVRALLQAAAGRPGQVDLSLPPPSGP